MAQKTSASRQGILLVNLGSPQAPTPKAVKPYLDEFLMDERVIDVPPLLRNLLVRGIILNFRPKKSAEAYRSIWWDEGSPLLVLSERLQTAVQAQTDLPVGLGMRYGQPSIHSAVGQMCEQHPHLEELLLVPLYPHYAMSSYETVVVKAREVVEAHFSHLKMKVLPAFYHREEYQKLLAESIRPSVEKGVDHLLFSYHGVPERHIRKGDITGAHCLKVANCCDKCSPAHDHCYRHQTLATTEAVAQHLGLAPDQYSSSFQSRLGSDPWLQPFTDKTVGALARKGVKKLAVVCPAFVSDCLETIEEIGEEAKEIFEENGGEEFTLIPCLNDRADWAQLLAQMAHEELNHTTPAVPEPVKLY
jgi:ferrochelatase